MKKFFRRFLLISLIGSIVFGVIGAWFYYDQVLQNPGDHLQREAIIKSMNRESPVFYRDGETQMNVLFQDGHRIYVNADQLPEFWVLAITSAEDQRFFDHWGLDPKGILRAIFQNIAAGRIVSGASTLTQQTAKNLFNRPDRSFRSKLEEAVNALRLEDQYSKEEILEFYANQFHVTGNGRGIGISARYLFDKDVSELTLLECAYIAGMVKGPSLYDPFHSNLERREANIKRAHDRVDYVLQKMYEQGHISENMKKELQGQEIPFKRGTFRYGKSSVVDEVVKRLEYSPFPEIFEEYNIDNPSTAGLKIITTIDENIQRQAQYGLVHHLSEVGGILEGVGSQNYILPEQKVRLDPADKPYQQGDLFYAKVVEKKGNEIIVKDGNGLCIINKTSLKKSHKTVLKSKGVPASYSISQFMGSISEKDILWVSLSSKSKDKQYCDIEFQVKLQGAVLALKKGEILAMVGGTSNSDFNRATDAQRQFGSTWKPLIYTAALQLGWSPTDVLDNRLNPFPFERVWYYPRSGHRDPTPFPSFSWTGVHSENRSSVWLLYHLTDRLNNADALQLVDLVGLSQKEDEKYEDYVRRIRDDLGVISTNRNREEVAYNAAKKKLLQSELAPEIFVRFQSIPYGAGARKEIKNLKQKEYKKAVKRNFVMMNPIAENCREDWKLWTDLIKEEAELEGDDIFTIGEKPPFSYHTERGILACGADLSEDFVALDSKELLQEIIEEQESIEPWVAGEVPLSLWTALIAEQKIQKELMLDLNPYQEEFLLYHSDFQQILNMKYINFLATQLGIPVKLPLSLTIPLGAAEISLLDASVMLDGIITGQRDYVEEATQKGTVLIKEIIGPAGEVLYKAEPKQQQVSNFVTGVLVSDILYNIVEHGTGRRARKYKTEEGVRIPLLGKTGTTNGFKNAAFVGVVPKAEAGTWNPQEGVIISTYVGYDMPKPMKYKRTKLSGSSGALPVWLQTVKGVELSGLLGHPHKDMNWAPSTENGFYSKKVNDKTGILDEEGSSRTWIYDPESLWGQETTHQRAFSPVGIGDVPKWQPLKDRYVEEKSELDEGVQVRIIPQEEDSGEPIEPRLQEEQKIKKETEEQND